MGIFAKAVAGDFEGKAEIKIGVLWTGPKSGKFKGLKFDQPRQVYEPNKLTKVVHLSEESATSFLGSAARGVGGAILLGGVGAIAGVLSGSGKAKNVNLGIEFSDGKKVIINQSAKNKPLLCLMAYAKENGIYEQELGF